LARLEDDTWPVIAAAAAAAEAEAEAEAERVAAALLCVAAGEGGKERDENTSCVADVVLKRFTRLHRCLILNEIVKESRDLSRYCIRIGRPT
jgi:hypothetical protein